MKTIRLQFLLILSFCFAINLNAQIPNGTTAPGWTATDIDGNVWDMYDILNSGKHVVLEFSATWCYPCWIFHNTGTLETLHDTYGPDGTDQIRVFYIEASPSTNVPCLYGPVGCSNSTQGDWVSGHDFAFINTEPGNANSMPSDYQVISYPTIYSVSANGTNGVYWMGQQTNMSVWESYLFESFEMEMSSAVMDATCPGDGMIQLNVENGAGNINYEWSTGAIGTDNLTGLSAGTYSVTATDNNGYELVESFQVGGTTAGPIEIQLLAADDVACYGEHTGVLDINSSGGNPGHSYQWSHGASSSYVDGLSAGEYSVQVTDSQGCTSVESYTVAEPDLLVLTSLPENANCGTESGAVVAFATGGIAPFSYNYGDGPNYTGTFENVVPGDYVMTVTDDYGCSELSAFTIGTTEGPMIMAEAMGTLDCSVVEVTVSGVGSSEGNDIEYEWSSDNGNIVDGVEALQATVSAAGTYTLVVTNVNSGCSESMSVTVDADIEAPVSDIAAPETLTCTNTMTTLDGTASSDGDNFTYSWTSADGNITSGANTKMANVNMAGEYSLLITNTDNGCTSSTTISVELDNEVPTVSVEDKVIDCTTTEVELCADVAANTTVTWMTTSGDVEANCITVSMAGTFMATARGMNGCESSAEAVVTLSADLPQVSIQQPEIITCTVPSVMIDAELEGEPADFEISWTDIEGDVINSSDLSIQVASAGIYTLSVKNRTNGCTTVASVTVDQVIINPEPAFTTNLNDGTLELSNTSGGDPSTFSWSFGSTDENPNTTFAETGTYEVCLTVTNDCGENTLCKDVYFVSKLEYQSEKEDVLCFGEDQGVIRIMPSGGEPGYEISWVGPNGFTSTDLVIDELLAGDYSMVLTDNYGYEKTETYTLDEPTGITQTLVEITDETNNDGNGSISINLSGGTGILDYEWSNGESSAIIDGLSAGDYTLIVTDENGCTKTFGPYNVLSSVVGVKDLDFVAAMQIYPVPAYNYLNVNIELHNVEATQMRIVDTYGKIISTNNFSDKVINTKIDVTTLAAGIYYLEFGNKNGRTLEKFVVIR